MGDPNSDGGRQGTRYQAKEILVVIILYSNAAFREPASNPILPSPEPTTPISRRRRTRRSARCGWATPRLRSGGRRATDARELLIVAILQSSAVSREGTISRPISMRLADRCFGPCGTAVRRLPGTAVGDTPICVGFRGARGKRSAVDAETWLNALSPSSNFEYLVIPRHHSGSSTSIVGGLVMKQEMNEYSSFDRL
jgi:hypothetical protein